jgi:hypothetical protein
MLIQYTGYQPGTNRRTYSFQVLKEAADVRKFVLSVNNESLADCKFKDQDIPDLCFAKMKRDLETETEAHPLPLLMNISDSDLQKYKDEHYPPKKKSFREV